MSTAVINIRVRADVKKQAQRVARELGMSLSAIMNGFLKNLVKTKTIIFSASEEPTKYLLKALKESKKDIKAGRVISFKTLNEEFSYLDKLIANDRKRKKS